MENKCDSCGGHKAKQTISDGYRAVRVCNPCAKIIQEKKRKKARGQWPGNSISSTRHEYEHPAASLVQTPSI